MIRVVKKTFKQSLIIGIAALIIGWAALLNYYNRTVKFPTWYKPPEANSRECVDASVVQSKFNEQLTQVSIKTIATPLGTLKAWHYKAVKNPTGKGVVLVHGGGGDHNLLNPYAHLLSQYGWDSLSIDLPNHGCSYNNGRGIQFGKVESQYFDQFLDLANSLFKTEALIATSMGVYVAAPVVFAKNLPKKLIFENPMLSFQKIVTDQKSYYIPPIVKPFFEWQILKLNQSLLSTPLTDYKPHPEQKILLLYGAKDKLTPIEQSDELVKAWSPQAQLKIIEGAGHAQIIQHAPGQIQRILETFLFK